MVCKNPRIFWRQYVADIDSLRHARDYKVKYVVATSGFFIELCQEVVVKDFKAGSLTPDTLSMESQRMSGKLKSPKITIWSNWSQTSCKKLSNTSIQLGSSLGGL